MAKENLQKRSVLEVRLGTIVPGGFLIASPYDRGTRPIPTEKTNFKKKVNRIMNYISSRGITARRMPALSTLDGGPEDGSDVGRGSSKIILGHLKSCRLYRPEFLPTVTILRQQPHTAPGHRHKRLKGVTLYNY